MAASIDVAVLEIAGREVPDRVPVDVDLRFVGDLTVDPAADWVDLEQHAVAVVVERVEAPRHVVVADDGGVVAPHLVRHQAVRLRLPAAADDVDVLVVEEEPDLGLLRSRGALVGIRLDEVRHRQHAVVDGLVEPAVDPQRLGDADGTHRGAPRGVAGDHLGRHRRGRVPLEIVGARLLRGRARLNAQEDGRQGEKSGGPGAKQRHRVTPCQRGSGQSGNRRGDAIRMSTRYALPVRRVVRLDALLEVGRPGADPFHGASLVEHDRLPWMVPQPPASPGGGAYRAAPAGRRLRSGTGG